jgi:hypothetical protein
VRTSESVELPAPASAVFAYVARLDTYPDWLRLVHDVALVDDGPEPVWDVELRARVGPFARSKRLRMQRVTVESDRLAVFERREVDGREHAMWALRAELTPSAHLEATSQTTLTMHLAYEGTLWTGGVLEKVLDEEIRRARTRLVSLLATTP